MTPKTKARKLFQKATDKLFQEGYRVSKPMIYSVCTLCIDEILNMDFASHGHQQKSYWKEVKEELDKL